MADETPEEKPKPRRRTRRKPAEAAETTPAPEETTAEETPDEIEPTPADEQAEEEAADVVLEAEAEIDEDSEPEADEEAEEPDAEAEGEEPEAEAEGEEPEAEAEGEEPEQPAAKPAARRRRQPRDPNLPPPVVRAQAKYVRSSARKARLVCDHIRGKSVEEARAILAHAPRAVAHDWSKLLESAVANAEHNHELVGEDLYVKSVHADEGPTIKRYRPRALGRATRIRKRTAHLTISLTPKE
jgi:ribosomal protein L22